MIEAMMILAVMPTVGVAILVLCLIIVAIRGNPRPTNVPEIHMPDGEQYKDKVGTPKDADYRPDIADQLDGRLTNIVKNPMKGIL